MRPPKERLHAMARVTLLEISAEAADLVDEILTEAGNDPVDAFKRLIDRMPDDGPWIASIERRMVYLMAAHVLFAFAPETRKWLEALEERAENGVKVH